MTGPVKNFKFLKYPYGDCTQWFGENPALYGKYFGLNGHNGIDIVRKWGENLYAVEDGIIANVKEDPNGYGKHVRMFSKDCKREWSYGHLSSFTVKVGQEIKEGEIIGAMGNTGFTNASEDANGYWDIDPGYKTDYPGTHCHFGLREIRKSRTGWSYTPGGIKIDVLNYGNGSKGSIDPLPFFATPKSLKLALLADKVDSKFIWQAAVAMNKIKI